MEQQQFAPVPKHIKFTFFDYDAEGGITEVYTITHALELATLESLTSCFQRLLNMLGLMPSETSEVISNPVKKPEDKNIKQSLEKNKSANIEKESSNKKNIQKFIKQITENPEFAKKVFKTFLREMND